MPQITQILMQSWPYFLGGAAIAFPLIVLNIRFASRLGLIDWPKARGVAEEQIPIIGTSLVVLSIAFLLYLTKFHGLSPWIPLTSMIMGVMGFLDDRRPISAGDKMFFQMICAAAAVGFDPNIHAQMTLRYGYMGTVLAFLFVIALINAVNFIDGIDGLAGLVLFMGSASVILFVNGGAKYWPYAVFGAALCGMLLPFLYFNVTKRKGFLGNVGSYFFSYVLATMHLSLPLENHSLLNRFSLISLCFLVPVADSMMVLSSRTLTLRSPFQPDKGHLHHRFVQTGIALRYILLVFGLIEGAGVVAAVLFHYTPTFRSYFLPVVMCLSYIGILGLMILMMEKASKRRLRAFVKRLDDALPVYFFKYEIKAKNGKPLSKVTLRRLEARVSAEIRITDICFSEQPNLLYVALTTNADPLRGIAARLDNLFQLEKVEATQLLDQGQIAKVSHRTAVMEGLNFRKRA